MAASRAPAAETGRAAAAESVGAAQRDDPAAARDGGRHACVVVAVDGGGTKTHAAVVTTDGTLVGFGRAGSANWESVGLEGTAASLHASVGAALKAARADRADVVASVFGLGGVDWPSDVDRLDPVVRELGLGGERLIVNDAFVALRAGTEREYGVIVIAGTGTVCAGRSRTGEVFRTLGLGWQYGDFGGASDISTQALRAVSRAYTGAGTPTSLSEQLCAATGADGVESLLYALTRERLRLPAVAPLVVAAAEAGDAVARGILIDVGTELGAAAGLVARRLGLDDGPFEVVLAGGVLAAANPFLLDALEGTLLERAPSAVIVPLTGPPVVGAALMGLALVDVHLGDASRLALLHEAAKAAAPSPVTV